LIAPPVIFYHKIDRASRDAKIRGAFTSPRRFELQMVYLKKLGVDFLTASELAARFVSDGKFPPRSIAVTFDDGWKDNYINAFPILQRLGITATIFLVPSCLGRTTDTVTAEGEGPREHLSLDDVREMAAAGIEMGSHTMNHCLLDRADDPVIEAEVTGAKNFIEDLVQRECTAFAYPAGFFTPAAKEIVRRAGHTVAFSTHYGPADENDLLALNRVEIFRRDRRPFAFSRKVRHLVAG
jgi:peptidoglycan/xylan/chitin deacetylase (PgdA/CDA1 family)